MKRIILFRHGHAEDAFSSGIIDFQRCLTAKGREKTMASAALLREKQKDIALWLTSPLLRAMQTMEIILKVYGGTESQIQILESLAFGDPQEIFAHLNDFRESVICLTGHQPTLGNMVEDVISRCKFQYFTMKKSGWLVLDFVDHIALGKGQLRGFYMPPDQPFWIKEDL